MVQVIKNESTASHKITAARMPQPIAFGGTFSQVMPEKVILTQPSNLAGGCRGALLAGLYALFGKRARP